MVATARVRAYTIQLFSHQPLQIISTTNTHQVSLIKCDYILKAKNKYHYYYHENNFSNFKFINYLMAPFDALTRLYYRVKAGTPSHSIRLFFL
jgi:hypothetical protein